MNCGSNKEVAVVHKIMIGTGTVLTAVLMVICLWTWQSAPTLAFNPNRSDDQAMVWAVRTAAIAAGALAQTVLLVFVIGNLYRTRLSDVLLRLLTATVFAVSLVSAIALGLAGR
jgi:uncharacterized membrane protein